MTPVTPDALARLVVVAVFMFGVLPLGAALMEVTYGPIRRRLGPDLGHLASLCVCVAPSFAAMVAMSAALS